MKSNLDEPCMDEPSDINEDSSCEIIPSKMLTVSSSMDPSRQRNPEEILAIENVINILSSSSSLVSQVMDTASKKSTRNNSTDNNSGSSNFDNNDEYLLTTYQKKKEYLLTHKQLDKIWRDLKRIIVAFNKLKEINDDAVGTSRSIYSSLDNIHKVVAGPSTDFSIEKVQADLSTLKDDAMRLKSNIPLWQPKKSNKNSDSIRLNKSTLWNVIISKVDELPSLPMNLKICSSSVFSEYQELFKELSIGSKLCCLSFTVFPANVVLKRRLLIDWWVGERLVDLQDSGEVLTELVAKGFIEPVKESHKLVADRFKMQPLMHDAVLMFATAEFPVYHLNGIKTVNSLRCKRAFLVETDCGNLELTKEHHDLDQEKLQTIFNINDPFPDQRFELFAKGKVNIVDWFSKMKNINVLYLGRWQSQHHIEVQSTEFLKGLKNMGCLRLLSLQGISRINELPNSIGKLKNLRILDLKACHNLEVLPDEIVSLKKLLRLDISECYLLDDMPKGLASLSELQVLKGFIIGDSKSRNSCTLEDLVGLKQLNKLSINTSSEAFPTEEELHALRELVALRKLAITWGGKTTERENAELTSVATMNSKRGSNRLNRKLTMNPDAAGLPTELEKLELQCFPRSHIPNWLIPEKLKRLKKLHITGGKELEDLGPNEWTVEILRLKHLGKFNMNWNELQTSFPKLRLLENVKCDELSSWPQGVWLKH